MRNIFLLLFTVCSSLFGTAQRKADAIDRYVNEMMTADSVPGATLLITQNGKVLKTAVYGYANVEHQVPAKSNTVYELASVSKPITATAIMQLVEAGKLSLDSSIAFYLGNAVPDSYKGVTVRRLMSHTSGLPSDHYVYTKLYGPTPLRYYAKDQLTDLFKMKPGVPGEKFLYSNAGFFMQAVLIEKVTGGTYQQYIQRNIFDKAGMKSARFINGDSIVPNRAQIYTKRNGVLVRFSLEATIQALDANGFGGLSATAADLDAFFNALYAGKLIQPATLQQMLQPILLNDGSSAGTKGGANIGLGWFLRTVAVKPCITHSGHTGTVVVHVPGQNVNVIFFSNLSAGYGMFGDKGYRVGEVGPEIAEMALQTLAR